MEQELRGESFGYRAKFIQRAAVEINEKGGLEWFQKVQNMTYKDAHTELVTLTGIGPKVFVLVISVKLTLSSSRNKIFLISGRRLHLLNVVKSLGGNTS